MKWIAYVGLFLTAPPVAFWLNKSSIGVFRAWARHIGITYAVVLLTQYALVGFIAAAWRIWELGWPWWLLAGWWAMVLRRATSAAMTRAADPRPPVFSGR